MFIKKLCLKNFRQFKGEHEIEFQSDEWNSDKNVTIILGRNTTGKTTLIQAFSWALYGETSFEKKEYLINLEVLDEMGPSQINNVEVKVELEHNNFSYVITRKQSYTKRGPDQAHLKLTYRNLKGHLVVKEDKKAEDEINRILPMDLSSYFFFDGERIGKLAKNDRHGKKEIAEAVRGVLGLNVIENAIQHLSAGHKRSVIGQFKSSIDVGGDKELSKLKTDFDKKEIKIDAKEEELKKLKDYIDLLKDELEEKEGILRENQDVASDKREIKKNEKAIEEYEEEIKKKENDIKKIMSNKGPKFFMRPLIKEVMEILDNEELSQEKYIPNINAKTIETLINRGYCICKTTIEQGSKEYEILLKEKELIPPKSIRNLVWNFLREGNAFWEQSENFYEEVLEKYKELRQRKEEITELEEENENLSKKIARMPDVGLIENKIRELKIEIDKREKQRENLIREHATITHERENIEKRINELAFKTEKNQKIKKCIAYAEKVNQRLKDVYDNEEYALRKNLEEKVNEIFTKMYHGKRKVIIDENYSYRLAGLELSSDFQDKAEESTGLDTVTSFSFITGIVALAKEKLWSENNESSQEDLASSYPLVMDAPFSNVDEQHVENVSNVLPTIANQVIIIVMHKDWKHAEEVLAKRVNRIYELEKKRETFTRIREVSS